MIAAMCDTQNFTLDLLSHINADLASDNWTSAAGAEWQVPVKKPATDLYSQPSMAAAYLDLSRVGVLFIAGNGTREAHESYLYQPEALLSNLRTVLYDQVGHSVGSCTISVPPSSEESSGGKCRCRWQTSVGGRQV